MRSLHLTLTEAEAELLVAATGMDHSSNPMCFSALRHEGSKNTPIIVKSPLIVKKPKLNIFIFRGRAVV